MAMEQEKFDLIQKYVNTGNKNILKKLKEFENSYYEYDMAKRLYNSKSNKLPSDIFYRFLINETTLIEFENFLLKLNNDEKVLNDVKPFLKIAFDNLEMHWKEGNAKEWYSNYLNYSMNVTSEFTSNIDNLFKTTLDSIKLKRAFLFPDSNKNKSIEIENVIVKTQYKYKKLANENYKKLIYKDIEEYEKFGKSDEKLETIKMLQKYSINFIVNNTFKYYVYSHMKMLEKIEITGDFKNDKMDIKNINIWCPSINIKNNLEKNRDKQIDKQVISQYNMVYQNDNEIMFGFSDGNIEVLNNKIIISNDEYKLKDEQEISLN